MFCFDRNTEINESNSVHLLTLLGVGQMPQSQPISCAAILQGVRCDRCDRLTRLVAWSAPRRSPACNTHCWRHTTRKCPRHCLSNVHPQYVHPQNISKHLKTLKTFELPTVFQYHHIFMYATLARITPLGPTSDAGNPTSEPWNHMIFVKPKQASSNSAPQSFPIAEWYADVHRRSREPLLRRVNKHDVKVAKLIPEHIKAIRYVVSGTRGLQFIFEHQRPSLVKALQPGTWRPPHWQDSGVLYNPFIHFTPLLQNKTGGRNLAAATSGFSMFRTWSDLTFHTTVHSGHAGQNLLEKRPTWECTALWPHIWMFKYSKKFKDLPAIANAPARIRASFLRQSKCLSDQLEFVWDPFYKQARSCEVPSRFIMHTQSFLEDSGGLSRAQFRSQRIASSPTCNWPAWRTHKKS